MKRALFIVTCLAFGVAGGWLAHGSHHIRHWVHHGHREWSESDAWAGRADGERGGRPPLPEDRGPPGDGGEPQPPPDRAAHLDAMLDEAQVSAPQRDQIHAIDARHQPELAAARADVEVKRRLFDDAKGGDADAATLQASFLALLDAKRAAELAFFAMVTEVRGVLTPEQRRKIEQAHREHHHRPPRGD